MGECVLTRSEEFDFCVIKTLARGSVDQKECEIILCCAFAVLFYH